MNIEFLIKTIQAKSDEVEEKLNQADENTTADEIVNLWRQFNNYMATIHQLNMYGESLKQASKILTPSIVKPMGNN